MNRNTKSSIFGVYNSWSPNSTYLHLNFYLLTYKEKKDIAGYSSRSIRSIRYIRSTKFLDYTKSAAVVWTQVWSDAGALKKGSSLKDGPEGGQVHRPTQLIRISDIYLYVNRQIQKT